jgi:hypothetical protein
VDNLLNVLLTAGVLSVIAEAVISGRRAKAELKRELHGLLRLIQIEVDTNIRVAGLVADAPDSLRPLREVTLMDDAWKETRVRLAQLLPDEEHFYTMQNFYVQISVIKQVTDRLVEIEDDEMSEDPGDEFLVAQLDKASRNVAKYVRALGVTVQENILAYIPPNEALKQRFDSEQAIQYTSGLMDEAMRRGAPEAKPQTPEEQ